MLLSSSHRGELPKDHQHGCQLGSLFRCLNDRCPSFVVLFLMCVFLCIPGFRARSHLLRVHRALGTLGSIRVESEDGFVTHGTHAADLQPLKQAPDWGRSWIFRLACNLNGMSTWTNYELSKTARKGCLINSYKNNKLENKPKKRQI